MAPSPIGPEGSAESTPGSLVERRAFLRFQWKGTASIRILPDGPDFLGVLLDVSERGCGIEFGLAIPAKVGAKVKVDLQVQGLTLARTGILRNMRFIRSVEKETRAGIEFIDGSGRDAEQIRLLTKELWGDRSFAPAASLV
jgi:c-di-GMP-binding flagellar brake protein YcgR